MSSIAAKVTIFGCWLCLLLAEMSAAAPLQMAESTRLPQFQVDPDWPQLPLPNNWALGELAGVAVDADDNVWIVHRPGTLSVHEAGAARVSPLAECCVAAPPVIQFSPTGKVLRAWGGAGRGYDWPSSEHGVFVDRSAHVWIGGNRTSRHAAEGPFDGMVLKFTRDGEIVMQIGGAGEAQGSLDTALLAGAAEVVVDAGANEVFVADGYRNNRIIVFDANTGAFKRLWGAYGKPPTDLAPLRYDPLAAPARQFNLVHCIARDRSGLIYVCDRNNNRIQVFRKDGSFVKEFTYPGPAHDGRGPGAIGSIGFLTFRKQEIMLIADSTNGIVRLALPESGQLLGRFGHPGNYAGQLNRLHQLAVDSQGRVYSAEAGARRVQRFVMRPSR